MRGSTGELVAGVFASSQSSSLTTGRAPGYVAIVAISPLLRDVDEREVEQDLTDAGADCVPNCIDSATELISSGLDPRGSLWDNLLRSEAVPTDLTFALREALVEMFLQRCWPLLERFSIRTADSMTYIVADRSLYDALWHMQGVIRDALLDLGLPDMGKIIAPADAQPTEPVAELPRPDWIGAEVWREPRQWRGPRSCAQNLGPMALLGAISVRWSGVFPACCRA